MSAWLFQDHRQKEKLGAKCPWSVGWIDPEGKRKSKRIGAKSLAEKFARKVEGQLASNTYQDVKRKGWAEFRTDYEGKVASGSSSGNQLSIKIALDHFQRLIKPVSMAAIKTTTIDTYRAARQAEGVSVATVNKELRHLKAALRVAHEWKMIAEVPKVRMLREPEKIPRFVTQEHFTVIYNACDAAAEPSSLPCPAGDWWRALLVLLFMTGWRIGQALALKWEDVDMEAGTAKTQAEDNKGKRDAIIGIHPLVVEHIRKIRGFYPAVFPWLKNERELWNVFHKIQEAAGISEPYYGFHDLRRTFATMNAESMTADALQKLMQHKSYTTTQRYINLAHQVKSAVANLHVPDVLRKAN